MLLLADLSVFQKVFSKKKFFLFFFEFVFFSGVQKNQAVAIATVGAPAPGMNHAVRACVRLLLFRHHTVFLVKNGFEGLESSEINEASWMSCSGWAGAGGSFLGTGRKLPSKDGVKKIKSVLIKRNIVGLIVIGGHEAYAGAIELNKEIKVHSFVLHLFFGFLIQSRILRSLLFLLPFQTTVWAQK